MEISSDTFGQKLVSRTASREQSTAVESRPSHLLGTRMGESVPTSRWGTVASFVIADLVGLLLLLGAVFLAAKWMGVGDVAGLSSLLTVLLSVFVVSFTFAGLYRQRFAHPALEMQRIATVTGTIGATAAFTVYFVTQDLLLTSLIAAAGGVGVLVMPLCRVVNRITCAQMSWWGLPSVVVASGNSGEGIMNTLRRWPEIGLRPVAVLTETGNEETGDVSIRGSYALAPHLAQRFNIPYAILALPSLTHCQRANLLLRYTRFFEHVLVVPDDAGAPALWTTGQSGDGLFGYGVRHAAQQPAARFVKRAMDVLGAGLTILLLLPVWIAIAVAIRRDSSGPVFFRQERMGEEGRIFTVLKFRTMYQDADQKLTRILETDPERRREYERYHKLEDDPRVTAVGRFLRRYSLDELPQLFNVLRGDMSLVGPRAYMPGELPKMNNLSRVILQGPPGVTGLWQVSGRNCLSFSERVHLDVHYMQNRSLWLDLYLLVRTIPTVLSGEGAS